MCDTGTQETTTDSKQSLNFGVYQFCEKDSLQLLAQGRRLLSCDDLDAGQLKVLRRYAKSENEKRGHERGPKVKLFTRSAFVEKVMYARSRLKGDRRFQSPL